MLLSGCAFGFQSVLTATWSFRNFSSFIIAVAGLLIVSDMPWQQSLTKRSNILQPVFEATLGRKEL